GTGMVSGRAEVGGGELRLERPSGGGGTYSVTFSDSLALTGGQARITGPVDLITEGTFRWSDGASIGGGGAARLITRGTTFLAGEAPLEIARSWWNDGTVRFTEGAPLRFTEPAEWVNGPTGLISVGYDITRVARDVAPFFGGPEQGAVDPIPVVAGPVTLKNSGTLLQTSNTAQTLAITDFRNLRADGEYLGRVELTGGGTLTLASAFSEQTGTIRLVSGSTLRLQQEQLENRGFVGGIGTLVLGEEGTGTLINTGGGTVAPGLFSFIGDLVVEGNFLQQAGGGPEPVIAVDLAGTGAGEFDRLLVSGTAELRSGRIDPYLLDGFRPSTGDAFPLVISAAGGVEVSPEFRQERLRDLVPLVRDTGRQVILELFAADPDLEDLPLVDQKQFLLTGWDEEGGYDTDQLAGLEVALNEASFAPLGADADASGGVIGPTLLLSPELTEQEFRSGEREAERFTREELGLGEGAGTTEMGTPQVQGVLQEVTEWMRGGAPAEGQACPEEGPC
ncbi:MAG: hypothetical protein VKI81_05620, partial [Synechococcaceae cyanobacterium]|nr:hypothetical protein [Synechococcaceae cyanobacterium]